MKARPSSALCPAMIALFRCITLTVLEVDHPPTISRCGRNALRASAEDRQRHEPTAPRFKPSKLWQSRHRASAAWVCDPECVREVNGTAQSYHGSKMQGESGHRAERRRTGSKRAQARTRTCTCLSCVCHAAHPIGCMAPIVRSCAANRILSRVELALGVGRACSRAR